MTNADDSPPSGSGGGNPRSGDGSREEPDAREGAGGDSGSRDTSADEDDSSGFSLPTPGSLNKSDEGSDEADETADDTDEREAADEPEEEQPEESGTSGGTMMGGYNAQPAIGATDEKIDEEIDEEVEEIHELDPGDLIVEEEPLDEEAEEDLTAEATFEPDEEAEGEFDHAPTMVSTDHLAADGPEPEGSSPSSGGLGAIAEEMQEAEQAGGLHEDTVMETGQDDTLTEQVDEGYQQTVVSSGHIEPDKSEAPGQDSEPADISGGVEQVDQPAGSSQPIDPPAVNQNPPTPEQSGRHSVKSMNAGSDPVQDPHADGIQQESPEPEGEFDDEATELFNSPFENDPICPRLTVLEGPSSGQEYLLNNLRNSIGRSTNNSVTVPDEAMSRQHLEVVKNPDDTFLVKDLQSVNGTYVNGTKVKEADLFHGDRLKVGKTTLQFVIPGQSPQTEDGSRRLVRANDAGPGEGFAQRSTSTSHGGDPPADELTIWLNRIIVGAVALIVPLALAFGYLTYLRSATQQQAKVAKKVVAARKAYLKGVEAVKKREWERARSQFESAKDLKPELQGLDAQFERLSMETSARDALEQTRRHLADGAPGKAIERAKAIPRESVYYEDAREILRRQRRRQRIASLQKRAESQFDESDYQESLATIQRILSIVPNHDDALALRRKVLTKTDADLKEARASAREKKEQEAARKKRRAEPKPRPTTARNESGGDSDDLDSSWLIGGDEESGSSSNSEESSGSSGGGTRRVVNFTKGFTLYKQKNFSAAISHFEEAASSASGSVSGRAETAAESIEDFKSAYTAAEQALASGDWDTAADNLRDALRADKDVASAGFFRSDINRKLARATAEQGLAAHQNGDHAGAFKKYEQAKNYSGSVGAVRELRRQLDQQATSIYIKAKGKKKTDPGQSAALCREIMSMVPASSETYKKARTLLDSI
jgi:pSer/pThr/pTyr-binding forkhead associated (FHA) protein